MRVHVLTRQIHGGMFDLESQKSNPHWCFCSVEGLGGKNRIFDPELRGNNKNTINILLNLMLSVPFVSEMHRTQSKYEDAYIVKVFLFQFINFYSSPIYIAFFKGR